MAKRQSRPVEVLLVEDNPGDVRLTVEAFKDGKIANRLVTVPDGVEALAHLRQEGSYREAARPDLILLDLNLPDIPGEEVLARIKADPDIRNIPVIMVSADAMGDRIEKLLSSGASNYLTKPYKVAEFLRVIGETLGGV